MAAAFFCEKLARREHSAEGRELHAILIKERLLRCFSGAGNFPLQRNRAGFGATSL